MIAFNGTVYEGYYLDNKMGYSIGEELIMHKKESQKYLLAFY